MSKLNSIWELTLVSNFPLIRGNGVTGRLKACALEEVKKEFLDRAPEDLDAGIRYGCVGQSEGFTIFDLRGGTGKYAGGLLKLSGALVCLVCSGSDLRSLAAENMMLDSFDILFGDKYENLACESNSEDSGERIEGESEKIPES